MMSQQTTLFSNNFPGFGHTESRSFVCCGFLGQAKALYPIFVCENKLSANLKLPKTSNVVCGAGSSGQRRNLDMSRVSRGNPRNRHVQNNDRDNYENIDDSEVLAPKLGPLFSFSGTSKSHSSGEPGPREKEIVELFRKVQAKLREKAAAAKEEKNGDASKAKDQAKDRTVKSLLNLLRKHSGEDGNGKISGSNNASERKEEHQIHNEDKSDSLVSTVKGKRSVLSNGSSVSRPASVFRRRSPIPQMKFQPIPNDENLVNSSDEKQLVENDSVLEAKLNDEPGFVEELELELDPALTVSDDDDEFSELLKVVEADDSTNVDRQQSNKHEALSSMKLTELRSLAKSRGIKGFSKMKKVELVDLLSGDGI